MLTVESDPFSQLSCFKLAICHGMLERCNQTTNSTSHTLQEVHLHILSKRYVRTEHKLLSQYLRQSTKVCYEPDCSHGTSQLGLAHQSAIDHTLHLTRNSGNSAGGKCCCWHTSWGPHNVTNARSATQRITAVWVLA